MILKGSTFVWRTVDTFLNVWGDLQSALGWALSTFTYTESPRGAVHDETRGLALLEASQPLVFHLESNWIHLSEVHGASVISVHFGSSVPVLSTGSYRFSPDPAVLSCSC